MKQYILTLQPLPGRKWRLAKDYVISTVAGGTITVPKGFVCDLNSMPRFLWWASTPTDFPEAGTVHDYLYDQQWPRAVCDAVYLEVLLMLGMGQVRARCRYIALRIFGCPAYRSHAKESQP